MSRKIKWDWKGIGIGGFIAGIVFAFVFLISSCPSSAQPSSSTISPRAFGSKSWRENGLDSLPLTGNSLWDVRLASNGQLYYWGSENEWVPITPPFTESHGTHQADVVDIFDDGEYYEGVTVEAALQEIGADPRWSNSRTPLTHGHFATDLTAGVLPDARVQASNVTQHESALEAVLDLQDIQGAVVDSQVPDTITKTGTALRCARFDASGVLTAASGDCASGDTGGGGGGAPGGLNGQVQFNDAGSFGGDLDLTWDKTSNVLVIPDTGRYQIGTDTCIQRRDSAYLYFTLCGTSLKGFIVGRSFFSTGSTSSPGLEVDINPSDTVAVEVISSKQIGFNDVAWRRNSDGNVFEISNGGSGTGTIQFADPGTRPTCSSSTRGRLWIDFGSPGVADTLEVCMKLADDSYNWRVLPN